MEDYKVRAIIKFNDLNKNVSRQIGDEFYCTKERYEYLKSKNAVELVFIDEMAFNVSDPYENYQGDENPDADVENDTKMSQDVIEPKPSKKKKKNAKKSE